MAAQRLSYLQDMLSNFNNLRKSRVYRREIDPLENYTEKEIEISVSVSVWERKSSVHRGLAVRRNCPRDKKKPLVVCERTGFDHPAILGVGKFS